MPRFVCLLRGVNVGQAQRVPMADFRQLLQALGHGQVRTLLNSGNAVFSSAADSAGAAEQHAQAVHAALRADLGLDIAVVVKTAADFLAAHRQQPIAEARAHPSQALVAWAPSARRAGRAGRPGRAGAAARAL